MELSIFSIVICVVVFQVISALMCALYVRNASKEAYKLNREAFGLTKKVEAMTATRREHFIQEYDRLVDKLLKRLPSLIASHVGEAIVDTEKHIFSRLMQLEMKASDNPEIHRELESLVIEMEKLESTLVNVTADAVMRVMAESRETLVADERFADLTSVA